MRLQGKRVLVTGGARGIGQGIAVRFLQEGASVFIIDNRVHELTETVEWLNSLDHYKIQSLVCDLSVPEQIEIAAQKAWECWDGLDILINNAGIASLEPFTEISFTSWQQIMDVNLNSMFLLSQNVVKRMIKQGTGGSIVNMTSKNGIAASSALAHYNASKGAIILLTQSMAVELAADQIRVNAVAPGFINTPINAELAEKGAVNEKARGKETEIEKEKNKQEVQLYSRTPMRRQGTVEEVANAFLFLASDDASYITGTTLVVDGGHLANAGEV